MFLFEFCHYLRFNFFSENHNVYRASFALVIRQLFPGVQIKEYLHHLSMGYVLLFFSLAK